MEMVSLSFAPTSEAVAAGAGTGVQHFDAVEVGLGGHTVDLFHTLVNFSTDGVDVGSRVGAVLRLNGQVTDTLQVVVDFAQRAFSSLRQRDTVVRVTRSNGQTVDVRSKAVSNCLTRCVIFRAVDTQTRRQALNRRSQRRLRFGQVVLESSATGVLVLITAMM